MFNFYDPDKEFGLSEASMKMKQFWNNLWSVTNEKL